MKIKKGDNVQIMRGKDRDKKGVVEKVLLKTGQVVVTGINTVTKHQKATKTAKQVGRIIKEMPLSIANVAILCGKCGKPTRIGRKILADGKKERICKRCGEAI
ncbi:50S ribosomal protein L24 [Candidatus Microgenomates bacterium]|nr:50S ribosomal protein L24 [Candidatus Microgenomates bacterium]